MQRHQNGVQDSRPIPRTLNCDPWGYLLLPVLSLPKHSILLWATSGNKNVSTLQPGALKDGSGVCCGQHLPIPGRTGDSGHLVPQSWHLLTLTYFRIPPVQVPALQWPVLDASQRCCLPRGSLARMLRKPNAPAKFSLLAKGHNVAPSGHSTQVVVLRPREKSSQVGGGRAI